MTTSARNPAVTFLLAAHEAALELAHATTPVPLPGQWMVVRDKHADRDAPLSLVQAEDPDVPEYEGQSSEDYSYGLPVIVLAADWQAEAEANLRHIALHDPASVLLRVEAEREMLAGLLEARKQHQDYITGTFTVQDAINLLAKGWGWTA